MGVSLFRSGVVGIAHIDGQSQCPKSAQMGRRVGGLTYWLEHPSAFDNQSMVGDRLVGVIEYSTAGSARWMECGGWILTVSNYDECATRVSNVQGGAGSGSRTT